MSIFWKILDIVEERRKYGNVCVFAFLKSILAQPFPRIGQTFTVQTFSTSNNAEADQYSFTRSDDQQYINHEYISFHYLFSVFRVEEIVQMWESLILERRFIFFSKKLSVLSSIINAITALLKPLEWQYIFIPILPNSLLSYCCAPMPFIVGVSHQSLPELSNLPTEEIFIVDCDKGFSLFFSTLFNIHVFR